MCMYCAPNILFFLLRGWQTPVVTRTSQPNPQSARKRRITRERQFCARSLDGFIFRQRKLQALYYNLTAFWRLAADRGEHSFGGHCFHAWEIKLGTVPGPQVLRCLASPRCRSSPYDCQWGSLRHLGLR
jgi:hypothetical protein